MKNPESLKQLGRNIQTLRNEHQLSQEQLAELCDLDRTYISSVERGKRNISVINIIKIADALKTEPGSLLKGLGGCNE